MFSSPPPSPLFFFFFLFRVTTLSNGRYGREHFSRNGLSPVSVLSRSLPPDNDKPYTVHELVLLQNKTSGFTSVLGAQRMGGVWRLHPKSEDSRTKLLLEGIVVRRHSETTHDKNPFIVQASDGKEIPAAKLITGNIPLSYSNDEIEGTLVNLGCKPRSKMLVERDRDEREGEGRQEVSPAG